MKAYELMNLLATIPCNSDIGLTNDAYCVEFLDVEEKGDDYINFSVKVTEIEEEED